MKKTKFLAIGIFFLLFLINGQGCEVDKDLAKEIAAENIDKLIVCNSPYIRHGTECCLDQNDNALCDNDEETKSKCTDECSKNGCSGFFSYFCLTQEDGCKDKVNEEIMKGKCEVECLSDGDCSDNEECDNYRCEDIDSKPPCTDECSKDSCSGFTSYFCLTQEDGCKDKVNEEIMKGKCEVECLSDNDCDNGSCNNYECQETEELLVENLVGISGMDTDGTNFWIMGERQGVGHEGHMLYKVDSDRSTILNGNGWEVPKPGGWGSEVAYNSGYVYVRAHPSGPIFKFNENTGERTTTSYTTQSYVYGMTFLGDELWQTSDSSNKVIFAQNGNSFMGPASTRKSLTSDDTNLYVGDFRNQKIYKVDTSGNLIETYTILSPNEMPNRLAHYDGNFYSATPNSIVVLEVELS